MVNEYFINACKTFLPNKNFSYIASGNESCPQTEQQFIDGFRVLTPSNEWDTNPNNWGFNWEQLNAKIIELSSQQPIQDCKNKAKQLIAKCDWSMLPDVGLSNVSDFETYRAVLRNLIKNPVANPVWPTEPDPIWN